MPGILLKKLSFVTCLIFIQPIYLTILITAHLKSIFRDCCPKHVNYKENVLKIVLSTTKECKVEYVLGIFSIYSKFIFWSLYFVESFCWVHRKKLIWKRWILRHESVCNCFNLSFSPIYHVALIFGNAPNLANYAWKR